MTLCILFVSKTQPSKLMSNCLRTSLRLTVKTIINLINPPSNPSTARRSLNLRWKRQRAPHPRQRAFTRTWITSMKTVTRVNRAVKSRSHRKILFRKALAQPHPIRSHSTNRIKPWNKWWLSRKRGYLTTSGQTWVSFRGKNKTSVKIPSTKLLLKVMHYKTMSFNLKT